MIFLEKPLKYSTKIDFDDGGNAFFISPNMVRSITCLPIARHSRLATLSSKSSENGNSDIVLGEKQ
jgi:hypothetical protein